MQRTVGGRPFRLGPRGAPPYDQVAVPAPTYARLRGGGRAQAIDGDLPKLEELVVCSRGKILAYVVHRRTVAMGFAGTERTTRRAELSIVISGSVAKDGAETLVAKLIEPVVFMRVEGRSTCSPPQKQVGELGVARQCRAMQVGPDHLTVMTALGAIAVTDAGLRGGQRIGAGTELREAHVVLKSGERRHAEIGVDFGDDFSDSAALPASAADIKDADALHLPTLLATEDLTYDLVSGADCEDGRSPIDRARQPPVRPEPLGPQYLWAILATADEVDVGGLGHGVGRERGGHLHADAPAPRPRL